MAGLPIRTTDLWSRLAAYIDRRLMRRPELRQAVSLPSVSDDVWVLTFSDGSTPICIGEV
jgi:hypothetical protein